MALVAEKEQITMGVRFRKHQSSLLCLLVMAAATNLLVSDALAYTDQHDTLLLSRATGADGDPGDNFSSSPFPSADGRYFVFLSRASNFDPAHPGNNLQAFRRDLLAHETLLVSRAQGPDGAVASAGLLDPGISADGRFLVFRTGAGNLHPDYPGGLSQVFMRDTLTHDNILVSRASGESGAVGNSQSLSPAVSANGRYVAFRSFSVDLLDEPVNQAHVYMRDLVEHETVLVSRADRSDGAHANNTSFSPSLSTDGRYIAFHSRATNLHPDATNGVDQVYVRDMRTHKTILVSRAAGTDGVAANGSAFVASISSTGRFVAFESVATNLHPDATDGVRQIFIRDLVTDEVRLVSRADGAAGDPGNDLSALASISDDGRFVTFGSDATNLHPDATDNLRDVYVRDLINHETHLVSRASGADGVKANNNNAVPQISANGRYAAFLSTANNLHPDVPSGNLQHVYLRDLLGPPQFEVDPVVLDFELVPSGETVGPLTITVTNVSDEAATILGVSPVDPPFNEAGNTCSNEVIPPEGVCTLSYFFAATDVGVSETIVTLDVDTALHVPLLTVRGEVISGLDISPEWLDFGEVTVTQTSPPLSVTLTNVTAGLLTVEGVSLPEGPFEATGGTCATPPFVLGS